VIELYVLEDSTAKFCKKRGKKITPQKKPITVYGICVGVLNLTLYNLQVSICFHFDMFNVLVKILKYHLVCRQNMPIKS
jgi:hypothetical protein